MIYETDYHDSDGTSRDDGAVSTVFGAILVFGLLVATAAFINVYYVPSWVADDEARHAQDVFVDFSAIPCHIDELVLANNTDVVSRQRIELGCGGIPIVSPVMSWGSLGTVPYEGNFTVKADVRTENITKNFTADNLTVWGGNVTNISSISKFYIYYSKNLENDDTIFINLTDQGDQSGRAEIRVEDRKRCTMSAWDDDGNKILDELLITANFPNKDYTIDLLSPCYGFSKVLDDANTTYNLSITTETSTSDGYIYPIIEYYEYAKTVEPYTKTSNGIMVYRSMNRYFLDQQFIYQNGAVFLCQPPDASMRIAPGITAEDVGNCTWVTIPMVTVGTGVNRTPMISGSGVEELQMGFDHVNRISFADDNNTDSVSVTIEPPEGNAEFRENYLIEWAKCLNAAVAGTSVGMSSIYATNCTNINVTLTGKIHLEIKEIEIEGRIASIT